MNGSSIRSIRFLCEFGLWKYWRRSIGDARITACCEWMRLLVSTENANERTMLRSYRRGDAIDSCVWRMSFQFFFCISLLRSCAGGIFLHIAIWRTSWTISFTMRQCGSHIFCFVPLLSMSFAFFSVVHRIHSVWIYGISASSIPGDKVQLVEARPLMWGACCLPIICNLSTTNSTKKRSRKTMEMAGWRQKWHAQRISNANLKCCCWRSPSIRNFRLTAFRMRTTNPRRNRMNMIQIAIDCNLTESFFVFTTKEMKKLQFQHRKQWSEQKRSKQKNIPRDSCSDSAAAARDVKRKPKNAWNRFLHGICAQCPVSMYFNDGACVRVRTHRRYALWAALRFVLADAAPSSSTSVHWARHCCYPGARDMFAHEMKNLWLCRCSTHAAIDQRVNSWRLHCMHTSSTSGRPAPETRRPSKKNCIFSVQNISFRLNGKDFLPWLDQFTISSLSLSPSPSLYPDLLCLGARRRVRLFAIMCSDRNEKLLLVLITVYSYLTLPFDFSSGLLCPYSLFGRLLLACIIFSNAHSIHRRQRKLLGHSFRALCYCSTFAQFHEWWVVAAHIARAHTHTSNSEHNWFPFFVSFLFVVSGFVRRMGVAGGSLLYQFSTCGVKYDLYSFGSSRAECVMCMHGEWQKTIGSVNNAVASWSMHMRVRVPSSIQMNTVRPTSRHIALSLSSSLLRAMFSFIRLSAQ